MAEVENFIATQTAFTLSSNERLDQVFEQILANAQALVLEEEIVVRILSATLKNAIDPGWTIDGTYLLMRIKMLIK